MTENPCERLRKEAEKAASEWIMWSESAGLPASTTPGEGTQAPPPLTQDGGDGFDEAREKEARARWLEALDALVDCVKENNL